METIGITPGPWTVNSLTRIEGPDFSLIASVRGKPGDIRTYANARAIAEVPALIQFIRDIADYSIEDGVQREARAILARIEGSS